MKRRRSGAALLICLSVVAVVTVLVVSMLETEMLHAAAVRNTADYERALYLAGSAVHHALAELEDDKTWRDGIPSTEFPAGSGHEYSAIVVDDASNTVVITGTGIAGDVTRKLEVTVQLGS